jgi:hypothetical protein
VRRVVALAGTVGLCLLLGVQPASAGTPSAWMPPECGRVVGDGSMTFSWNAGNHLTPTSQPMSMGTSVTDVDALATANRLLAVSYDGRLSASDDAGCSWHEVAQLEGQGPFMITPAADGSAYVWTRYNDVRLYRVAGSTATEVVIRTPTYAFMALAVDPADAGHLRVVDAGAVVFDSVDGGSTFAAVGSAPASPGGGTVSLYDAAIAPTDLDRVVLGTVVDGAFTSGDGGRTWARATMAPAGHRMNVFTVAVSPVDPSAVWAMGLDITEHDSGAVNDGRHIFRSTDGGRTFRPVVDHDPDRVTITNGLLLVPHPVDPTKVYFEFGTWFWGHGTDLFTYDAGLDQLTFTHNGYDDVTAIAFNPRFPMVMYLGLAEER